MKLWATTQHTLWTMPTNMISANAVRTKAVRAKAVRASTPRHAAITVIAISMGISLAFVPHARAQLMGGPMGGGPAASGAIGGHPAMNRQEPDKPAAPAPDAVPGAKAREPAAPATRQSTDMSPNDALFDAINRGDIAGARDALNRGADLNAVNILGMTPMELSVDLGRNDISFLLLSMRGDDGDQASQPEFKAPAHVAKGSSVSKRVASGKATAPVNIPVQKKPVATPKLFANDGGEALPAAGFLGFGSKKETN